MLQATDQPLKGSPVALKTEKFSRLVLAVRGTGGPSDPAKKQIFSRGREAAQADARLANVKPLDGVAFPVVRRRGATIFGVAVAWGGRAPTPGKP